MQVILLHYISLETEAKEQLQKQQGKQERKQELIKMFENVTSIMEVRINDEKERMKQKAEEMEMHKMRR